jgi:hypothetical protein
MFEASVHPVILLGEFQDLFLKKLIHATRVDGVTSRREIAKWPEDFQSIPFVVRKRFGHEGYNPRAPQSREA